MGTIRHHDVLRTFTAHRPGSTMILRLSFASLALGLLAACGGGDGDDGDAAVDDAALDGETDGAEADPAGGDSMATLTVDGERYTWAADKMELCLIGGDFPVDAEFREVPRPGDGDWFQFFDRGDGGIHFSAILGGKEYSGTGAGEADEIRADGFTYTGNLNQDGAELDAELEVTC